jgi:hypothetical protein
MLGSALKTKAAVLVPRVCSGYVCPTLSRVRNAGGTEKVCADWAFVSGVSLVPPFLELIEEYRNGEWKRQGEGLVGATLAAPGQARQVQRWQAFVVRH